MQVYFGTKFYFDFPFLFWIVTFEPVESAKELPSKRPYISCIMYRYISTIRMTQFITEAACGSGPGPHINLLQYRLEK